MPTLSLRLSPSAEKALMDRIARKVGAKAREVVTALHKEILNKTPMNTGRTLASWYASAGSPIVFDAESVYGEGAFTYDPARFADTNNLPVGREPGREGFEKFALISSAKIDFEKNPYRVFFITNGAALDSIANSDLNQGAGSRASNLEYGNIASYDLYGSTPTTPRYIFTPRGIGAMRLSVEKIRLKYGK